LFGIPATRYYGLRGVVWSMVLANVLYVVVAFILLERKLSTLRGAPPNVSVARQAEEGAF
jgi:hypothetical protein